MSSFCNGPFVDGELSWNTTNPDLTQCFRDTVLIGVPAAVLWILGPIWALLNYGQRRGNVLETPRPRRYTRLSKLKMGVICVLILNVTCELATRILSSGRVHGSDLFMLLCLLPSFILSFALLFLEKRWSCHTSWPQFSFYFLLFIGTVPTFKVQIERLIDVPEDWQLWLLMITFCPVIGIMLFLTCWADLSVKPDEHEPMETYCSAPSQIFFSWMGGLVRKGYRSPLTFEDLPNTPSHMDVGRNALEFLKRLKLCFDRNKKASLWPVLVLTYGPRFLVTFFVAFIHYSLTFVSPQILKLLIRYISSEDEPTWKGYFYAFVLLCSSMIWTLSFHHYIHDMCKIALKMRSSVVSVIYRKAMRLSSKARRSFTVGEITNYVSVDAQRIVTTMPFLHGMWGAPYMVCLAIFFLYQELGICAFAGVAVLLLLIPFNVWAMRTTEQLQETQLKAKDNRIKLVNEALTGMKVLKLYAWENPFMKRIEDIRMGEISTLRKAANIWAFLNFTFACSPFLVTVAIFAVYVALDPIEHVLTAEKIFVTIALFNLIRIPLILFPFSIFETIKLFVSINRINKFLHAEDLDPNTVSDRVESEQNCIEMKNASFSWGGDVDTDADANGESNESEDTPQVILKGINLEVKKKSLVAVVGVVGSGKSSLLSAMLGEMLRTEGGVNVSGKVAYVSQQAWIQNMTLRDNILFRSKYKEDKYNEILEACALNADMDVLPAGDKTEIGENGINLSGGQKQRISLARAVYSDSEIYLFDDPLSAVDAHVGKHIFSQVISSDTGCLRDRTRILVTHGIGFLDKVDIIYVMKDGAVAEVGSYVELMASKGAFSEFLTTYQNEGAKSAKDESNEVTKKRKKTLSTSSKGIPIHRQLSADARHPSGSSPRSWAHFQVSVGHDEDDDVSVNAKIRSRSLRENDADDRTDSAFSVQRETEPLVSSEDDGQLVEEEMAMVGRVKWSVYLKYIENIGGGVAVFCLLMYFVGQGLQIGANAWLSVWADANEKTNGSSTVDKTMMYLSVYSGIGISACFSEVVRELALFISCVRASKVIHERLLHRIFRTPMSFFDTNPIGRIVNRFSADIDTVDNTIPFELTDFSYCFFEVLGVIAVISYSTPLFLTVFPPIFAVYFFVQRYYIATSRQLKRIESIKKSPIFSHFSESVNGVSTIRAFKQQNRFCAESEAHVMNSVRCFYLSVSSNRWLGVRIETIGNFVVLFAAIFAVLSRGLISPGLAGLSITYSLNMTDSLNWLVRMLCDLETNSVAIERILEYSENPQEADVEIPEREKQLPEKWPEHGAISFEAFKARYRPGLDLVLKGVDMDVGAGEKVGICGRTGAGKSSLTLALFRIVEAAGGRIIIDGQDISELGLYKLRSSLTIIPQDPVLFTGNIRFNLDPTSERTDEEVWRALELAHLKKHVTTLSDGIQHEVSEGGENFSVGQRQLICLARALLRKTKILILDEATAAVDLETDDLIQATIRGEFADCTVLTIAHRLYTIMDSTKIAVFEAGKLAEFAQPKKLLDTAGSALGSLAKDAAL